MAAQELGGRILSFMHGQPHPHGNALPSYEGEAVEILEAAFWGGNPYSGMNLAGHYLIEGATHDDPNVFIDGIAWLILTERYGALGEGALSDFVALFNPSEMDLEFLSAAEARADEISLNHRSVLN